MYKNIQRIGQGGAHQVYIATLAQNREDLEHGLSLDCGTEIKLRMHLIESSFILNSLEAYAHLQVLRDMSITPYIPKFFGVYYAPTPPNVPMEYNGRTRTRTHTLYTEMELVDSTYFEEYLQSNHPMEDRVVFEDMIGQWAAQTIAHVFIRDFKLENFGLKHDPNYAIYHIGKKSYMFSPGYSPRRFDLDIITILDREREPEKFKLNGIFHHNSENVQDYYVAKVRSPRFKQFLPDINKKGILKAITDNLFEYEVTSNRKLPPNVKHYTIPDEYLKYM